MPGENMAQLVEGISLASYTNGKEQPDTLALIKQLADAGNPVAIEYLRKHYAAQLAGEEPATELERFKLHRFKDALGETEPPRWLVKGFLEQGDVVLLYGSYGVAKTYLVLDLAVCIASGAKSWADFAIPEPRPVLLIDEENGPRRLRMRLNALANGRGVTEDIPLAYTTMARFDVNQPDNVATLQQLIQETGAWLIVVDSLMDITPGAEENSVKEMNAAMQTIGRIAKLLDVCFIVLHHENKSGGVRGSTAIPGQADNAYQVRKDGNKLTITSDKVRDNASKSFSLIGRWETDPVHGFTRSVYFDPADETEGKKQRFNVAQRFILLHLLEYGETDTPTMKAQAETEKKGAEKTIQNAIDWLKHPERGYIKRTNPNEVGQGTTAQYGLTEKGREAALNL